MQYTCSLGCPCFEFGDSVPFLRIVVSDDGKECFSIKSYKVTVKNYFVYWYTGKEIPFFEVLKRTEILWKTAARLSNCLKNHMFSQKKKIFVQHIVPLRNVMKNFHEMCFQLFSDYLNRVLGFFFLQNGF